MGDADARVRTRLPLAKRRSTVIYLSTIDAPPEVNGRVVTISSWITVRMDRPRTYEATTCANRHRVRPNRIPTRHQGPLPRLCITTHRKRPSRYYKSAPEFICSISTTNCRRLLSLWIYFDKCKGEFRGLASHIYLLSER